MVKISVTLLAQQNSKKGAPRLKESALCDRLINYLAA